MSCRAERNEQKGEGLAKKGIEDFPPSLAIPLYLRHRLHYDDGMHLAAIQALRQLVLGVNLSVVCHKTPK